MSNLAWPSQGLRENYHLDEALTEVPGPFGNGRSCYAVDEIRAKATVVRDLAGSGLLAVIEDDEAILVSFVVFTLAAGGISDGSPDLYELVFRGSGVSGSLRELRHTQWGDEDGYLASPDGALIADAFVKLRTWFDC